MTTKISGDTGVSQCQPNSVSQGDVQVGVLPVGGTVDPSAGQVGEILSNTGSLILTSASAAAVVSLALTAGVWDVQGNISFSSAGTHTLNRLDVSISPNNNAVGALRTGELYAALSYNPSGNGAIAMNTPLTRIVVTVPTTYYLIALTTFTTAGLTGLGTINARRAA